MTPRLHPATKKALDAAVVHSAHALIVSGPVGAGLTTAVEYLLKDTKAPITRVLPEKDEKIDFEKGSITIQSIRRLYDQTKTRLPGGRVILIDFAERMGVPAQNAFLKLLEEPGEGTRFVLLTHEPELLLPTIRSRSQTISIRPIGLEASQQLLDDLKVSDPAKRAQLVFIAGGLPALLTRLARDEDAFAARVAIVRDARTFVSGSSYNRLRIALQYKANREDALQLLRDSTKILQKTLSDGGDSANALLIAKLERTYKRIAEQGNIRLQLSALAVF